MSCSAQPEVVEGFVPHAIASSQHPFTKNTAQRFLLPIDYSVWPDEDLRLQVQLRRSQLKAPAAVTSRATLVQTLARRLPRPEWFKKQVEYLSQHLDPIRLDDAHQERSLFVALYHWQAHNKSFTNLLKRNKKATLDAVDRINKALRRAPPISKCVLFRGMSKKDLHRFTASDFRFSGAQEWMATSYDLAIAAQTEFMGANGILVAIHITAKQRALWVSSHLFEHQHLHTSKSYHEREVLLRVKGKRFQINQSRDGKIGRKIKIGQIRGGAEIDVVVVTLEDADADAAAAADEDEDSAGGQPHDDEEDDDDFPDPALAEEEDEEDSGEVEQGASSSKGPGA